jgi:hypothetical protein
MRDRSAPRRRNFQPILCEFEARRRALAAENQCAELGALGHLEEADGLVVENFLVGRGDVPEMLVPMSCDFDGSERVLAAVNGSLHDRSISRRIFHDLHHGLGEVRALVPAGGAPSLSKLQSALGLLKKAPKLVGAYLSAIEHTILKHRLGFRLGRPHRLGRKIAGDGGDVLHSGADRERARFGHGFLQTTENRKNPTASKRPSVHLPRVSSIFFGWR